MVRTRATDPLRTSDCALQASSEGRDISSIFLSRSVALFEVDPEVREVSPAPAILVFLSWLHLRRDLRRP